MFSKNKLREALRLYTEAVMWASPCSEVDRDINIH